MKRTILVAEDNAIERAALCDIMRSQVEWELIQAEDGQAAWDLLSGGLRPDLCILDLRMPRLDGVQLLGKMRGDPEMVGLKVVVASGVRDRNTIVTLARLNLSGYLLKPYDPARTASTIRQLLEPAAHTALIADDMSMHRTALAEIIRSEPGWQVVEAGDGEAAWELLSRGLRPDIALFDIRMPKLDGPALLQRIRDNPELRDLRVVIISSKPEREQLLSLARLQIAGYLVKPFDAAKVKSLLR